jgi:hypothetical protein
MRAVGFSSKHLTLSSASGRRLQVTMTLIKRDLQFGMEKLKLIKGPLSKM